MLEKEILKSCKHRLDYWQMQKVCVWWDRLNSGKMQFEGRYVQFCKPGTPDLVAYLAVGNKCHVCFFECKKDEKAEWSKEQKSFYEKFRDFENVHYQIITNPNQIDRIIEIITNHNEKQLELMDKYMGGL